MAIGSLFNLDPRMSQNIGNILGDLGYGLLQGKNLQQGLAMGAQRMGQMQPYRDEMQRIVAQDEKAATARNSTVSWLKSMAQNDPRFAQLAIGVESGAMDPNSAFATGIEWANPAAATPMSPLDQMRLKQMELDYQQDFAGPGAPDPTATVEGRTQLAQQHGLTGQAAQQFILTGKLPDSSGGSLPTSYREFQLAQQDPAYAAQLSSSTSKPPTDAQRRATQLASVVNPELKVVEENWDELANGWNQVGGANVGVGGVGIGTPGKMLTSSGYQRATNALNTIAQSYLYSVSGAAAPAEEVRKLVESVTPFFGEDETSRKDKKARVQQMVEAINLMTQTSPGMAPAGGAFTVLAVEE
jgi:hypothetical protein